MQNVTISSLRGRGLLVVAVAAAIFAAWVGLHVGGETVALWFDDVATAAAATIAAVLCVGAARRHDVQRPFWTMLAAAAACWAVAEVTWGVYDLVLRTEVPVPSWADVGYLAAIPLAVGALLAHPATRVSGTRRVRTLLDALVVAAALLFLGWATVLGPIWADADLGAAGDVVSLAYPFGDVVILVCVVLAIRGMRSGGRLCLAFLTGALAAMAVTDMTYSYLTVVKGYEAGGLIDTGWFVAYVGIAVAAWVTRPVGAERARAALASPSLAWLVAPLVPVLIALTVLAVDIQLDGEIDRTLLWLAVGLVAIVIVRQVTVLLEILRPGRRSDDTVLTRLTATALGGAMPERVVEPPPLQTTGSRS